MKVGIIKLELIFPGCQSLKEKRGIIKPFIHALQSIYKVSAAEIDFQDKWQHSLVGCACISNSAVECEKLLEKISGFANNPRSNFECIAETKEIINI